MGCERCVHGLCDRCVVMFVCVWYARVDYVCVGCVVMWRACRLCVCEFV